jgi:hypothetical protein
MATPSRPDHTPAIVGHVLAARITSSIFSLKYFSELDSYSVNTSGAVVGLLMGEHVLETVVGRIYPSKSMAGKK